MRSISTVAARDTGCLCLVMSHVLYLIYYVLCLSLVYVPCVLRAACCVFMLRVACCVLRDAPCVLRMCWCYVLYL